MKSLTQFITESLEKTFGTLQKGDKIYFVYFSTGDGTVDEGEAEFISSKEVEETEYVDKGVELHTKLLTKGLKMKNGDFLIPTNAINKQSYVRYGSSSIVALDKNEVEEWKSKNLDKLKKSFEKNKENTELERAEQQKKHNRMKRGEFESYEEEVGYWEDYYDHEGSKEQMDKWDKELKEKIEQAKKKWNK